MQVLNDQVVVAPYVPVSLDGVYVLKPHRTWKECRMWGGAA